MIQTIALASALLASVISPMSLSNGVLTVDLLPQGDKTAHYYPDYDVSALFGSWEALPNSYGSAGGNVYVPIVGDKLQNRTFFNALDVRNADLSASDGYAYYVTPLYGVDVEPGKYTFDFSNLPVWTDGVGWSPSFSGLQVGVNLFAVLPVYYRNGEVSSATLEPFMAVYLELGFGRTGYYPLQGDAENSVYIFTARDFLSVFLERFGYINNYEDYGDIGFLASLGQNLTSSVADFKDVLGIKVLGNNLLLFLTGSGFFLFAGWIIVKFVVGL